MEFVSKPAEENGGNVAADKRSAREHSVFLDAKAQNSLHIPGTRNHKRVMNPYSSKSSDPDHPSRGRREYRKPGG